MPLRSASRTQPSYPPEDRKRCGECKPQPSQEEEAGSGTSIALGTALDAVPEALVLGVTLRAGGPDLALSSRSRSQLSGGLSGTAGMRLASRSSTYVLSLWSGTRSVLRRRRLLPSIQ